MRECGKMDLTEFLELLRVTGLAFYLNVDSEGYYILTELDTLHLFTVEGNSVSNSQLLEYNMEKAWNT